VKRHGFPAGDLRRVLLGEEDNMTSLKAIVTGVSLLAITAGPALAQQAYCDNYARDYANRTTHVGGDVAAGALFGAGAGALIGSATGGGGGKRAATGALIGALAGGTLAAASNSPQWNAAYRDAFDGCMRQNARPIATGNACDVGSEAWYNYCDGRPGIGRGGQFKSFNPQTGTYRGYDGQDHFCLPSYC